VLNAVPTVSITSPANGATFTAPANITINATAADTDGTVTQVAFYVDGALIDTDTTSPYSAILSRTSAGIYTLTAVAFDNHGAERTSTAVRITVSAVSASFTNQFTQRATVTGSPLTITGNNSGYNAFNGEPDPTGVRNNATGWIAWTAQSSGRVVMDTFGSAINTVLAVYTGENAQNQTHIASNDNSPGGGVQSELAFTATAGVTYNIQISGRDNAAPSQGNLVLNIVAAAPAPFITGEPQSQTVARGATAAFTVTATGQAPLTYHWRYNGAPIAGSSATLTLNNVQGYQEGNYWVIVSNSIGTATSASAALTVNDGLVSAQTTSLLTFSNSWKYEQSGADLGTAWREPAYDDSLWPSGQALLGFEVSSNAYLPEIFRTPLSLSNGPNFTVTFYFRTHFTLNADPEASVTLTSTNLLDDGAVYYLNGVEAGRLRIAAGPVNSSTLASTVITEGALEPLALASASRVQGDNVLAVEVHQSSIGSSDVAFGMALIATVTTTNRPVIVNPVLLGNGSFQGTLQGVAGRKYAVDFTGALGGSWTTLTTFTNTTGSTTFTHPGAGATSPRFYRGRWVP